jgi:cell division protein FtsQ
MPSRYLYMEEALQEDHPEGKKKSSLLERRLKRVLVIILLAIGAELCWLLLISPFMPLGTAEIIGIPEIDRRMVLAQAGINSHSSYMTLNTVEAEIALGNLYQVESAQVIKRFPDSVRIILKGRQPAAMSLITVEGRTVPVFLDRQGVVFKIGDEGDLARSVPLVSGLFSEEPFLGMRLSPAYTPFLTSLERFNQSDPELLSALSEIGIHRKDYNGFDLILYPRYQAVRIRASAELNEDMLRYMMLAIDVIVSQGTKVYEIDFRNGTASYTLKEGSSG